MKILRGIVCWVLMIALCASLYAQTASVSSSTAVPDATKTTTIQRNQLLSADGQIMAGPEPNSIMVIDYPDNLKQVEDYVKMVDVPPQQVLIEARIVEVTLKGEDALGINWSSFAKTNGLDLGRFKVSGAAQDTAMSQLIPYKNTQYGTSTADEDPFTMTIFDENSSLVIRALSNTYDTNILSAPSITTINNRPAQIRMAKKLPWVKPTISASTSTTSGGVTVPQITWEEKYEDVGITLNVTPTINEDGNIMMDLEPIVSEHADDYDVTATDGSGGSVSYSIPIIDMRTANTKVLISNGRTLIIGGMMKDKTLKGASKVPFMGDIPFLGKLFKSTKETHEKTMLLIFVSPTVVRNSTVDAMERKEKKDGKWYYDRLTSTELSNGAVTPQEAKEPVSSKAALTEPKVVVKEKIVEVKSGDDSAVVRQLTELERKVGALTKRRKSLEKKIFSGQD